MKIGIDGRPFLGKKTGVGRYVTEICIQLSTLMPDSTFFVYSPVPIHLPPQLSSWIVRVDPHPLAAYLRPVLWLKLRCGLLASHDSLDVFWGPAAFLPTFKDEVKTILTVHDVVYSVLPASMSLLHLCSFLLFFRRDVSRASALTVNSYGTMSRVTTITGRQADAVIYPSVASFFSVPSQTAIDRIHRKYGINSPFFLAVATLEPRKNLRLLIQAFNYLQSTGRVSEYELLLVGNLGWNHKRITAETRSNPSVRTLGYIPDSDLPSLYYSASAFVFPSLYEGFGMPVLEARMSGAKIIASGIPEIIEAGGDNCTYINPDFTSLVTALASPSLHASANLCSHHISSWKSAAHQLFQLFTGI